MVSNWKFYENGANFRAAREVAKDTYEAVVIFVNEGNAEVFHGVVFLSDYTDEQLRDLVVKADRNVSGLVSMDTAMLIAESYPGREMSRSLSVALLRQIIPGV